MAYNEEHGIIPQTIKNEIRDLISVTKTVAKEEVAAKDLSLEAFAELPEVEGLRSNLVETLYNEGLTSAEAFATVTEEEVLALKGVGPATVKKLKENGVSFKA